MSARNLQNVEWQYADEMNIHCKLEQTFICNTSAFDLNANACQLSVYYVLRLKFWINLILSITLFCILFFIFVVVIPGHKRLYEPAMVEKRTVRTCEIWNDTKESHFRTEMLWVTFVIYFAAESVHVFGGSFVSFFPWST